MNLNEYIELNKKKAEKFIAGVAYQNIGKKDKRLVNAIDEASNNYFNRNEKYRTITEKFLLNVLSEYNTLIDTELEFASTKDSVDKSMESFAKKIYIYLEDYKEQILKEYLEIEAEKAKDENRRKNGVYPIKIDRWSPAEINILGQYSKEKENPEEKQGADNILDLLHIVYNLIWKMEDKQAKLNNILDVGAQKYKVNSEEYRKVIGDYLALRQEKDYEKFIELYDAKIKEMTSKRVR